MVENPQNEILYQFLITVLDKIELVRNELTHESPKTVEIYLKYGLNTLNTRGFLIGEE